MSLGAFSISLDVKDIHKSKTFYEDLGFSVYAGDITHNWIIMKNGETVIGLFQGMIGKNTLTFNPGWDQNAHNLHSFIDIRDIQKRLKKKNLDLTTEADEKTTGPASFTLLDPDGNPILFDQHV